LRAREAGADLPPLLRSCGLTVHDIMDETVTISVATQIKCLNFIAGALHDRLLGFHVAQSEDLRQIGTLYYIVASSEFLGEALQRAARYTVIVNEGIGFDVAAGKLLKVSFRYTGVSRLSDRHQIEAWMTLMIRTCREVTGRSLQPVGVRIMHQRIPESVDLDNFLGRSVEFGADRDEITFARDAGSLPITGADPYLNKILTAYCEEILSRRKSRSGAVRADVENAIAALLPHGHVRIEAVARRLNLSPRTLRRKLASEDVTFAGVLQSLRYDLAKLHLEDRGLSISRIAWLLGYTEVSAFSHAFRRWSGRAPRAGRPRARRPARQVRSRRSLRS
jgi:AraC-like DNA-binding protein